LLLFEDGHMRSHMQEWMSSTYLEALTFI